MVRLKEIHTFSRLYYLEYLRILRIFQGSSEAATRGALYNKVFLEISQNSQENT